MGLTSWSSHDGALFARELGSGPPVVLLHGLIGSSRYWGSAFELLAEGRHLIVPDLLGFGRSPKPTSGYTPDDHVDALLAMLDEIDVGEPALIGAHSAGSIIALRLAARHPERVKAVVAFGPPLYRDANAARRHLAAMGPMAKLFALPGPLAAAACAWVCAHRASAARLAVLTHPHLPADVAADSVAHTWASYTGTLTDVVLAAEAAAWLPAITSPITLVSGDKDRVVDAGFLAGLARTTQVRNWRWPGNHHLPLQSAQRCVELVVRQEST